MPFAGHAARQPDFRQVVLTLPQLRRGLDCPANFWRSFYDPTWQPPQDEFKAKLAKDARRVVDLARRRFSNGPDASLLPISGVVRCLGGDVLAEARATQHMVRNDSTTVIFSATFLLANPFGAAYPPVLVRPDILERVGTVNGQGHFNLYNVLSAVGLLDKDGNVRGDKYPTLFELSAAVLAAEANGVKVNQAGVVHVSKDYVYGHGEIDPQEFLTVTPLTGQARAEFTAVKKHVRAMTRVLGKPGPGEKDWPLCLDKECVPCQEVLHPTHPARLYHMGPEQLARLKKAGVTDLSKFPINEDDDLFHPGRDVRAIQQRMIEAIKTGKPILDEDGLKRDLAQIKGPISFLDFETLIGAFPILPGTSPYDQVPLQFSNHVLGKDGNLLREFHLVAPKDTDPLRTFALSLIDSVGGEGSIVAWHALFEKARVAYLAKKFPDLAEKLNAINKRFVDLLIIVRNNLYDTGFNGSFSIKSVLPVLVPGFSYEGLDVTNGTQATTLLEEYLNPNTSNERRHEIRSQILEYCGMDSLAMVEIYKKLVELAA